MSPEPAEKATKPARKRAPKDDAGTFSAEEKAAMKDLAAERRRSAAGKNGEQQVLEAIAAMDDVDRPIAEGLHALVQEVAPQLGCKTWYGFPAYTTDPKGKDVLFFYQFAGKFGSRYGTIGFNDKAQLDEGAMWPVTFAVTQWDDDVAKRVAELIRRALG